jgi:hypothetical protein
MNQTTAPSARRHLVPFFISVGVLWILCFYYSLPWHLYAIAFMTMAFSMLRWFGWTRKDAPTWVLVFLGVPAGLLLLLFAWAVAKYYTT